jgi:CheY-like chemotaxis protein
MCTASPPSDSRDDPVRPAAEALAAGSRPVVLVVTADPGREAEVRAALLARLPGAQLSAARHILEAVRLSFGQRLHLVVLDWAVDGGSGPTLMRHLARWRPDVDVLAFDNTDPADPAPRAEDWTCLAAALNHWLRRCRDATDTRPDTQ